MSAFFDSLTQATGGNAGNLFPGYRKMQEDAAQTADLRADAAEKQQRTQEMQQETYAKAMANQEKQQQMQFEQAFRAKAQELATGIDPTDPKSIEQYSNRLAKEAMAEGHPNLAFDYMQKAEQAKDLYVTRDLAALSLEQKKYQVQEMRNEAAENSLGAAHDQESMDRALKGTPLEGQGLSWPNDVGRAITALKSEKERVADAKAAATESHNRLMEERDERRGRIEDEHWKADYDLRVKEADTRAGKEKAGAVTAPSKNEAEATKRLILNRYPGLAGKESANSADAAAESVASSAKAKILANPALARQGALGWETAVNQAMTEQKNSFNDIGKGKTAFVGGGNTIEEALPQPADPDDLVGGKYYEMKSGQKFLYDGENKQIVLVHEDGKVFTAKEMQAWKTEQRKRTGKEEEKPSPPLNTDELEKSLGAGAAAGG